LPTVWKNVRKSQGGGDFLTHTVDDWPPKSPDFNPLDCQVFRCGVQCFRHFTNGTQCRSALHQSGAKNCAAADLGRLKPTTDSTAINEFYRRL